MTFVCLLFWNNLPQILYLVWHSFQFSLWVNLAVWYCDIWRKQLGSSFFSFQPIMPAVIAPVDIPSYSLVTINSEWSQMHHFPFLGTGEVRASRQLTSEVPFSSAPMQGCFEVMGGREFLVIDICFQNGNSHLKKSNSASSSELTEIELEQG